MNWDKYNCVVLLRKNVLCVQVLMFGDQESCFLVYVLEGSVYVVARVSLCGCFLV